MKMRTILSTIRLRVLAGVRLFAAVALIGVAACDDSHKLRIMVYPDASGKNKLFVNDQPLDSFPIEKGTGPAPGDIYEPYYVIKTAQPSFHVVIKGGDTVLHDTTVEAGKYVANLSSTESIWFTEFAYGSALKDPPQSLNDGTLGVYRVGRGEYGVVVFRFDQKPPDSIRVKRSKSNQYFILGTYTDKGMELAKSILREGAESTPAPSARKEPQGRRQPPSMHVGVIEFSNPSGEAWTVLQLHIQGKELCHEVNKDFWNGVRQGCPGCVKKSDSCSETLAPEYRVILTDKPYKVPYVSSHDLRMIPKGTSLETLRNRCVDMANKVAIGSGGVGHCVYPERPSG